MSYFPMPTDTLTGAVQSIAWEHSRIHDGKAFRASGKFALGNGATTYFYLNNPSANYPHLRLLELSTDSAPMDMYIFEAPTVTVNGSAVATLNCNRNSATAANLLVYSGATVTADGTQVDYSITSGSKQAGGQDGIEGEWILKANTKYAVKITNNSGGAANYALRLFWYEP